MAAIESYKSTLEALRGSNVVNNRRLSLAQLRARRASLSLGDFQPVACIGHGAFGVCHLVVKKSELQAAQHAKSQGHAVESEITPYVIKQMSKDDLVRRQQATHVLSEKAALSAAQSHRV